MKVQKVDHIHIYVHDIDAAIAFWSDILGTKFSEVVVEEEWRFKATMEPLGVELVSPTTADSVVGRALESREEGLAAISLKVDDIEEATRELEAKGLRVVGRMRHGGLKEVQFHPKDAYGVMIELAEYQEQHGAIVASRQELT